MPFRVVAAALLLVSTQASAQSLDANLRRVLAREGFTGTIESKLTDADHLDRAINLALVGLGSFLWFDPILSLHNDATCASCHSPTNGWGDTQPIAIGVQSNYVVGVGSDPALGRVGPRNLRRSPMTANSVFYPTMMWDGRFSALSGDPFDNSSFAFSFPAPEGDTAFPAGDPNVTHLLAAQAFLPVTEFVEMAGFGGTAGDGDLDAAFAEFDVDDYDDDVPDVWDDLGYRHDAIRDALLERLNGNPEYVRRFSRLFPPASGGSTTIEFWMVGAALAEFQFNQIAADSPFDKYARGGPNNLLTAAQKRGALVFFGKGNCVSCHAVDGTSNEMFSDFQNHVAAVPQVAPVFGAGTGNAVFDGTDYDEDYGLERTTGDSADRYKFRTAPLRNLAMSPAYFHNGAFTDLERAIRYHLDARTSSTTYDPTAEGVPDDLSKLGPFDDMLDLIEPALDPAPTLTNADIANLVTFLRDALLDSKITPTRQCDAMPELALPSGNELEYFPGCP